MTQLSRVAPFSQGDQFAPYLGYECTATLYVASGGQQLPLAYQVPASGAPARATSRLVQAAEPTCTLAVEWAGSRRGYKPEPPRLLVLGTFVLLHAAARVGHVGKDSNGMDVVSASGYLLLASSVRPEDVVLPALWTPYDGRYNTSVSQVPQYLYTPGELGFGEYLPGQTGTDAADPAANQVLGASGGGNKILGE